MSPVSSFPIFPFHCLKYLSLSLLSLSPHLPSSKAQAQIPLPFGCVTSSSLSFNRYQLGLVWVTMKFSSVELVCGLSADPADSRRQSNYNFQPFFLFYNIFWKYFWTYFMPPYQAYLESLRYIGLKTCCFSIHPNNNNLV